MDIGKRIAARRRELGMTQEELAEKITVSVHAVSRWENGWSLPELEKVHNLSEALQMNASVLIGEDPIRYEWELRDQLYSEEHMFTRLKTFAESQGLKETYSALYYMREHHSGQLRKKQKFSDAQIPYIVHPLMMACHALSMGLTDDELLAILLLHDVCEDCGILADELPFSDNVRETVALLTKPSYTKETKKEKTEQYYEALQKNRFACVAKVIDRCNNVSTMAQSFSDKKLIEYIEETETYVFPVLTTIKKNWPEYNNVVFLVKYQMLSVLESLKVMLMEKNRGLSCR